MGSSEAVRDGRWIPQVLPGGAVAALGHEGESQRQCTSTLGSKAARGTSMWPHGWCRGKPVKSTIFWILTRMCIRYPLCPEFPEEINRKKRGAPPPVILSRKFRAS